MKIMKNLGHLRLSHDMTLFDMSIYDFVYQYKVIYRHIEKRHIMR